MSGIFSVKQISARVQRIIDGSVDLFDDLRKGKILMGLGRELLIRCRKAEHELMSDWVAEVQTALTVNDNSGMHMKGKLMKISQDGLLVVNYSSRLVQLLREVRQLNELGLMIPADIRKVAEEGEQYYRFGIMLRKVANFFNNMDTEILRTQRPMLLNALVAFEDIVEKRNVRGGAIEWNTPTECAHYVERLQAAAAKLARENRHLRLLHQTLGHSIVALLDIDMLRRRNKWKQLWQEIQGRISTLADRYPIDRMRKWILHWDCQIYKVLETAYCGGLETLN